MGIPLRATLLTLAVLLGGHQLVYLATYAADGTGQALPGGGHGGYWLGTGALVSAALGAGLLLGLRRWLMLRAELRIVRPARPPSGSIDWRAFRWSVLRLAPRLALAALVIFFVQENLEHYASHAGHVPGLSVLLGPEYVATIPLFALVAAVVAGVTSLLRLGLAALARIVDRLRRLRPARSSIRPGRQPVRVRRWSHLTPDLGRAPPHTA